MPIASSQLSFAPNTIPLWYLDETTGLWKEEGMATKTGSSYVGTVQHFSTWNCDYSGPKATISGIAVDCNGGPLPNVIVTINQYVHVNTDQYGNYTTWVPAGWNLTFQVLTQGAIMIPSQVENVAPLSDGQVFNVPALVVPCPATVGGQLTNCTGTPEAGIVGIIYSGHLLSYTYTPDGIFSLLAPINATITLTAISASGYNAQTLVTSGNATVQNIGILQNCNNATTAVGFTITGRGLTNTVINTACANTEAHYIDSSNTTSFYSTCTSNIGAMSFSFDFPGSQPITHDFSTYPNTRFFINVGGLNYHASYLAGDHFIMNVTYYGIVGDSIKGNFSGKLVAAGDPTGIQISNGHFALLRGMDE